MLVRICNTKLSSDSVIDCIAAAMRPYWNCDDENKPVKTDMYEMIFTFKDVPSWTFGLSDGDEIYYMNDDGKTIVIDRRMCRNK